MAGGEEKSIFYQLVELTKLKRLGIIANIIKRLAASATISFVVKRAGYSAITYLEAVVLIIVEVLWMVFSYLLSVK